MEYIDILTPTGEFTGTCEERAVVHTQGLWHRTVHVWMRNADGEILFQRRSSTKETHPDLWDISCAGHLSAGDSSIEGAVREAFEELGLVIDVSRLIYLFTMKQHWENPEKTIIENEIKDVYLYDFSIDENKIKIDPAEVSGFRFISIQKFENEIITNIDQFVPHEEEYGRLLAYLKGDCI